MHYKNRLPKRYENKLEQNIIRNYLFVDKGSKQTSEQYESFGWLELIFLPFTFVVNLSKESLRYF